LIASDPSSGLKNLTRWGGAQAGQLLRHYCSAPQARIDTYLQGRRWFLGRCSARPGCISQNVTAQDAAPQCIETAVTPGAGLCAGATMRFSTCDFSQAAADARAAASLQVRPLLCLVLCPGHEGFDAHRSSLASQRD
jgi:hypothetical protein